jgi:S1-C subfamily serine protease
MRYGQKKSFNVTLTELADAARVTPASNNAPAERPSTGTVSNDALGISMQAIPPELAARASLDANKRGVLVTEVVPLGPAYQKLAQQDVIYEVLYPAPRRAIRSVADLQSVLSKLKTGDYVSLNVHSLAQGVGDRVVNIRIGE